MNQEQEFWKGSGGDAYTTRSKEFKNYEFTDGYRFDFIKEILSGIPRYTSVLELGCNSGNFIGFLKELGFTDITGVEINKLAYETARQKHPDCQIFNCAIEDFLIEKKYGLVVTSGVLIHIKDLALVISKINQLSKKWIFGNEYFSQDNNVIKWPSYCASWDYAIMFGIKPVVSQVHTTKEGEQHSFYLIEK